MKEVLLLFGSHWRKKMSHKARILIVDDDKIVLESCKRILESEGYSVILASSSAEAIQILGNQYLNLMIMDVKMPEKDGVYLLKTISEKWPLEIYPLLPVLVMSGYPTPDTLQTLYKQGAREFISKPFTPDELLNAVKNILQKEK